MSILEDRIAEAADFFAGRIVGDSDVILAEALDRRRLDFSVESLRAVDEWLEQAWNAGVRLSEETAETIIWAGAYLGEVIRRNAKRRYRWLPYEEYMESQSEEIREMIPYTFGTQFILAASDSEMTLPINKVCRWLDEGPENNLHYYASAEISEQ